MTHKLPSFFKLPRYNEFNYIPRFYDKEEDDREKRKRKVRMKHVSFQPDSELVNSMMRYKSETTKKWRTLTAVLRLSLILLFILVAYLIADYFGLMLDLFYSK